MAYHEADDDKLPDELDSHIRHEASRRDMTLSEWTREALMAHLPNKGVRKCGAAGVGHSGRSDISERIEEILRGQLVR